MSPGVTSKSFGGASAAVLVRLAPMLIAVVALTACVATTDAPSTSAPAADDVASAFTLVVSDDTSGAGFDAIVSGTIGVNEQLCITIDDRILVTPAGSSISADGTLTVPGYAPVAIGDAARFDGGQEEIPWSDAQIELQECSADGTETVLISVVSP